MRSQRPEEVDAEWTDLLDEMGSAWHPGCGSTRRTLQAAARVDAEALSVIGNLGALGITERHGAPTGAGQRLGLTCGPHQRPGPMWTWPFGCASWDRIRVEYARLSGVLPDADPSPGADLPVRAVLPAVLSALDTDGSGVLVAPPGSGKTTLVPLALADRFPGRIVVAEPRRVAARAAARRMATLLGGDVGSTVGYSVRGDSRTGPSTRVEVVTTGLLVARLQRDPDLPGVGAVILDECHERQLDCDLALAFTVDVRATLRPDLVVLATSATAQADRLAACLGGPDGAAPVVSADTASYPVEVIWCPPPRPVDPPHGMRVDPRLLDHVAATVRRAVREADGDVLVFLPGAGEINAVGARLAGLGAALDVVALHGRLPAGAQDAALRAGPRRRVVLASSVAESSLTVPGVRIVVDAGLTRVPRVDLARGLGSLVTVRTSRASAHQRAGRAGREAPGRVYRCWSAGEHDRLAARTEPEIAVADLTDFALQLACWGHPHGDGLALPDAPPAAAMTMAGTTLRGLSRPAVAGAAHAK